MKALVIVGPTATGKTALALKLAEQFDGELISADSRQIYSGIRILSGQDIPVGVMGETRMTVPYKGHAYPLITYSFDGIPVWLYDAVEPTLACSIALFRTLAVRALLDITNRGKLPIIVGGAGLYVDAILSPPETIDIPVNAPLRQRLTLVPIVLLQKELQRVDAVKFSRMNDSDKHNPRRLVRAIEVALWKQQYPQSNDAADIPIEGLWIGLTRDSEELADRIAARVEKRWQGAIDEVKRLGAAPSPAVQTALGVKEISAYLSGVVSEKEAMARWIRNEQAYAVRQFRWFKKREYIHWYDAANTDIQQLVVQQISGWYTR